MEYEYLAFAVSLGRDGLSLYVDNSLIIGRGQFISNTKRDQKSGQCGKLYLLHFFFLGLTTNMLVLNIYLFILNKTSLSMSDTAINKMEFLPLGS